MHSIFYTRFDLMAKYLYIKYNEIQSPFYKELYHQHFITFNNCWEHPGDKKTKIEDFINAFNELIRDMKNNGFNKEYPVPIGRNGIIINGAHRLVTSFYFNKETYLKLLEEYGCPGYNYKFFLERTVHPPLSRLYTDTMALEFVKLDKNMRCMVIYPTAFNYDKINLLEQIIIKYSYLYYSKSVNLNFNGVSNLIKELYREEEWIGGLFPMGFSPGGKAERCVSNNLTQIYLFHMYDLSMVVELKEKCRELFQFGKHSLHISDYPKDTFRISSSLLNENSIHFLNNGTNDIHPNTKELLGNYFDMITENELERDDYCLTSSLILEMYGLRKARDIDYLHKTNKILPLKDTGIHKDEWLDYYHICKDELIYNPNNYFYFNGFKCATIEVIKKMKENRNETKDIKDIELIKEII